jgi:hypothetical protein
MNPAKAIDSKEYIEIHSAERSQYLQSLQLPCNRVEGASEPPAIEEHKEESASHDSSFSGHTLPGDLNNPVRASLCPS